MSLSNDSLVYLAERLEKFNQMHCVMAAKLVRKVQSLETNRLGSSEAEHAFYHFVWDCISRAIDQGDFGKVPVELEALEKEMAGQVFSYWLDFGWFQRAKDAPLDFRPISDFL
jgi:hypothetical protein